jgi:DNA-binding response OmpR family regulator
MKILLVEDDPLLGEGVADAFKYQGHVVEWACSGQQALTLAQGSVFDVVVLDLGLPDMEGLAVLSALRKAKLTMPVLILTARDSCDEKVLGLDQGADDYMAKPFDLPELLARLRALVRRHAGRVEPVLSYQGIEVNPAEHSVMYQGQAVAMSRHEFELLSHLMAYPTRVFSREVLVEQLYSWSEDIGSNTVEVYVHHLRKKLGKSVIETVRGVGYRLGQLP